MQSNSNSSSMPEIDNTVEFQRNKCCTSKKLICGLVTGTMVVGGVVIALGYWSLEYFK